MRRLVAPHRGPSQVERDPYVGLHHSERRGRLARRVVEDLAQQKDRSLGRRQGLERDEEGERDAFDQVVLAFDIESRLLRGITGPERHPTARTHANTIGG
jgi:hypothetical protein